jgi:hypothetical protein
MRQDILLTAGIPRMVGLIRIVSLNQNSGIGADIPQLRTYTHYDMSKLDWLTRLEDEKAAASVLAVSACGFGAGEGAGYEQRCLRMEFDFAAQIW